MTTFADDSHVRGALRSPDYTDVKQIYVRGTKLEEGRFEHQQNQMVRTEK